MKKFLLTGVAVAALACGPALAADLPVRRAMPVKAPPPVTTYYDWSGIYVGAHAGGGWSDNCFTFAGVGDGCHDGDGWLGGGQIGFNYQAGQFVVGAEFSGSWADINGSHGAALTPGDTYKSDVNSIFLLTGRVGLAVDRMLLYVNGGGAWVRDQFEYNAAGVGTSTTKQSRTGWTVGAGVEYGLTPNWSIAAQYNYIDLGDKSVGFGGGAAPFPFTDNVDQQVHLATVRLNYRFGGGGPLVGRF